MKMKRKWKLLKMLLTAVCAGLLFTAANGLAAQAAEPGAVLVQMPGYVVEQWSAPKPMLLIQDANVRQLADKGTQKLGRAAKGMQVYAWGQSDNGWYFIQWGDTLGYIYHTTAQFMDAAQQQAALATQQQAALAAQQQAAALAAQQAALAVQQSAGIVFIGDSRMVTLKEAVERNLGACPAAVVARGGSRYEWFHDTGIPQADKIIGKGSRVVINMGVNDLNNAGRYAQDVNAWAAVWIARGAKVYYASVNPVYANSYGMTEERVGLFNSTLRSQLIPQIIWLDSNTYLKQSGVHASDGVHYKDDTNLILFNYYMTMIGA